MTFKRQWDDVLRGEGSGGIQVVWKQGWGVLQFARSIHGLPLRLADRGFASGLGTHADSEIVLRSARPMSHFRAMAGVDDNPHTRENAATTAPMIFSVEVGERTLWQSPELGVASRPVPVDLKLPANTRELTLRVAAKGGAISHAHADWAEASVAVGNETVFFNQVFDAPLASQVAPTLAPFSFL